MAFSAGLTDSGSVGPFDEETTLIFSKIITNVGGAYNQSAGRADAHRTLQMFDCRIISTWSKVEGAELLAEA